MTEQKPITEENIRPLIDKRQGLSPYQAMFPFSKNDRGYETYKVKTYAPESAAMRAYKWSKNLGITDPVSGKPLSRSARALIIYLLEQLGHITDDMFRKFGNNYLPKNVDGLRAEMSELLKYRDVLDLLEFAAAHNQEQHKQELNDKGAQENK